MYVDGLGLFDSRDVVFGDLDFDEEFAVPDFFTDGRGNVGVILHFYRDGKINKLLFLSVYTFFVQE